MEEYEMTCEECNRRFRVQVTTMNVPGGKEKEEIWCPYCGHLCGHTMTSGFVRTFKIEGE